MYTCTLSLSVCTPLLHVLQLMMDNIFLFIVFPLISRRKFSQIDVLEGLNVLIGINGRKNKLRIYYLTWLKQKILKGDEVSQKEFVSVNNKSLV